MLELRVPELLHRRSAEQLLRALSRHGYVIGGYFVSFAMLANFWVWHHREAELVWEVELRRAFEYFSGSQIARGASKSVRALAKR